MSVGDAIIASTALMHQLSLLTNNESDFKDLSQLKLIDISGLLT
jgi:predicted nucleic acid-binding protein